MIGGRARTIEAPPPTAPSPAPGIPDRRPPHAVVSRPRRDDAADFPLRVVRAMHEAARSHRARLEEELELRRVALMTGIRDDRRAEVVRARQVAAQDRLAVDAWAATAQRQIKTERGRRKVQIDADLRRALREQNQRAERRVKQVEAALAAYRTELDAFFEAIDRDRDPVAIARRARQRPAFPLVGSAASNESDRRAAEG